MPKYPLLANRRAGRIAQRLLAKMQYFPCISFGLLRFCLHLLNVEEAVENFKNAQRLFSYFCSFQPNHLQPDSNWCDSSFKPLYANFPPNVHKVNLSGIADDFLFSQQAKSIFVYKLLSRSQLKFTHYRRRCKLYVCIALFILLLFPWIKLIYTECSDERKATSSCNMTLTLC